MDVVFPASNVGKTSTYTYTVSADNDYAYIKNAAGTTVARATNTGYTNGYNAGWTARAPSGTITISSNGDNQYIGGYAYANVKVPVGYTVNSVTYKSRADQGSSYLVYVKVYCSDGKTREYSFTMSK